MKKLKIMATIATNNVKEKKGELTDLELDRLCQFFMILHEVDMRVRKTKKSREPAVRNWKLVQST